MTQLTSSGTPYVERPPRLQPPLPEDKVIIPPPPEKHRQSQNMWQLLLPAFSIVGYSLVSALGGARNLLLMIPMGLTIVVTIGGSLYSVLQERRRVKELERAYANRLRTLRHDMESAHMAQRLYYQHTHPDPQAVAQIGQGLHKSRLGERLWERAPRDHDFGSLRLGRGDIPSRVIYEVETGGVNHEDPQMNEAQQLALDSLIVTDAPVIISLRPTGEKPNNEAPAEAIIGRHSIGFSGRSQQVSDMVRALVMQFAAFHSPVDTQIHVIGAPYAKERWQWADWLPHTNNEARRYRGDRMCFFPPPERQTRRRNDKTTPPMTPQLFWKNLNKILQDRKKQLAENDKVDVSLPFLLVIVDNLPAVDAHATASWLDNIDTESAVSTILHEGPRLGASLLVLGPQPSRLLYRCQALVEVLSEGDHYRFQYAEIGQNTPRFVGSADAINTLEAEAFARAIQDKQVHQGYGADLPNSVTILDLFQVQTIPALNIQQRWEESRARGKSADWLRAPLGKRSSEDDLRLYFHQDYDGVHGLVAGTTGSGKSELLLTLIGGLAISYDPSILNFVLVDYKGGAAFDPFRTLPHTVDIVTDVDKKAVERMFEAIKSELTRRSKMLADYEVKHIVEYRAKGYHLADTVLPPELLEKKLKPQPFPHLFIIVDEFAEMVNENKDYKDRFDSITRLGRAIGVSLLLAAQRPTGAVSDQMRANMKLHICLRVETSDDSRELLGQGDAMFLPSSIPGRAYMQAGRETPVLVQVARAGGLYVEPNEGVKAAIEFDVRRRESEGEESTASTIVDLIVSETIEVARRVSEKQYKPWPDPLPAMLSLNEPVAARHLVTKRRKDHDRIVLNPFIRLWMKLVKDANSLDAQERQILDEWREGRMVNWESRSLRATIGMIDLPDKAQQHLMTLDLTIGPVVIFGAGGWGKTTALKSLMISLAASHTPRELHFYVLDFARGGLKGLVNLPHMETPIDVTEEARVERLLRMLATEMDRREPKLRVAGSLALYNEAHPDDIIPALVVIVDNFAEFKETYEDLVPEFTRLMRGGRALGIYFVVTADQVAAIPNRLYSLMTQRLTLKMADPGDYQGIVGRAAHFLTETPGRGALVVDRQAREFHIAVPTAPLPGAPADEEEYDAHFVHIADAMQREWGVGHSKPEPVEALSDRVSILEMLDEAETCYPDKPRHLRAVIGQRDVDRWPALLDLNNHAFVIGPTTSGKTQTLHSLIVSLAETHTPDELAFVLIDPKQWLFVGEDITLNALPHVLKTVSEPDELDDLDALLQAEFDEKLQTWLRDYPVWAAEQHHTNGSAPANVPLIDVKLNEISPKRQIAIVIDNYDDTPDMERPRLFDRLARTARQYRGRVHVVIGLTADALKARDELIKRVDADRNALVLQDADIVSTLGGRVRYGLAQADLPQGRGFIVKSGRVDLLQVGRLMRDGQPYETALAQWVNQQASESPSRAQWFYGGTIKDLLAIRETMPKDRASSANAAANGEVEEELEEIIIPPVTQEQIDNAQDELAALLNKKYDDESDPSNE